MLPGQCSVTVLNRKEAFSRLGIVSYLLEKKKKKKKKTIEGER